MVIPYTVEDGDGNIKYDSIDSADITDLNSIVNFLFDCAKVSVTYKIFYERNWHKLVIEKQPRYVLSKLY